MAQPFVEMASRFEDMLDKRIAECATAALACPLGDSLNHAMIKGKASAFEEMKKMFREAERRDVENEVKAA